MPILSRPQEESPSDSGSESEGRESIEEGEEKEASTGGATRKPTKVSSRRAKMEENRRSKREKRDAKRSKGPEAKEMIKCLQSLGFNHSTSGALMDQGIKGIEDLMILSDKDVDEMIKSAQKTYKYDSSDEEEDAMIFPYLAVKRLKALRFWAEMMSRTGESASPSRFTPEVCRSTLKRMEEENEYDSEKIKPDRPDELKIMKHWTTWWEKWDNYMSQIRGAAHISLTYVYRTGEEQPADADEEEMDTDTWLYHHTLHSGQHFKLDNHTVYKELKSLVVDGPLWTYVKKYDKVKNGRAALLALKRQMEGESFLLTRKNQAYGDISTAAYSGERQNWTFAQYVAKHQQAHNELEACNESVPETKKVTDFLAGITDPTLVTGLSIVMSDKEKLGSFELCQQFLGTLITNTQVSKRGLKRGVSQVNVTRGGAQRGGFSNPGKKRKGGNQKGRSGSGTVPRPGLKGLKAELRDYTIEEWHSLTNDQKEKVRKLRKARDKVRKVSRLATEREKADDDDEAPPASVNHGNQFGRRGGNRGK